MPTPITHLCFAFAFALIDNLLPILSLQVH